MSDMKLILIVMLSFFLCSCASLDFSKLLQYREVEMLYDIPAESYEVLGEVSLRSSEYTSVDWLKYELKREADKLGGDAVIGVRIYKSVWDNEEVTHITGIVIKWK